MEVEKLQNDDTSSQNLLEKIYEKLRQAYKDEELYWKRKSRNTRLKGAEILNSSMLTKIRQYKNRIIGLSNSTGLMVTSDTEIKRIVVQYFSDIFATSSLSKLDEALEHVPTTITEDTNIRHLRRISEKEVKTALFKMHPEKALGPGSMTALFFQKS